MKKILCGNEMDRMPDWSFRIMAFMFNVADFFKSPDKKLDDIDIKPGQTVIDWGCGTGRYLKAASQKVGANGIVYAVDIQSLAVESAKRMMKKYGLENIRPRLTDGRTVDIPTGSVDLIYALDMFHMVSDPGAFLKMLSGLLKPGGTLILEDGHQPRSSTREKVLKTGLWEITAETGIHVECRKAGHI
jgi:cyclopropane fatty-acyl-phospholipid synthase-like methyltransferase